MSAVLDNPAYAQEQRYIDREGERSSVESLVNQRLRSEFIRAMDAGPTALIRAPGRTAMKRVTLAVAVGDDMAGEILDEAVSLLLLAAQGSLADESVRAELHHRATAWWAARARAHADFYAPAWAELIEDSQ